MSSRLPAASRKSLACRLFVASRKSLASPVFVVAHDVSVRCVLPGVCSNVASVPVCGARSNLVLKLRRMTWAFTGDSTNKNRFSD